MTEARPSIDASVYRLAYLGLARQVTGRATLTTEELHREYGGKPDAQKLDQSIVQLAFQQGLTKQQVFDLLAVSPQVQYGVKQGQPISLIKRYAANVVEQIQPRATQGEPAQQPTSTKFQNRG